MPQTQKKWKEVSNGFNSWWNFPNCLGPVDGKHVQILSPENSDSSFFNYKGTFSVMFFALVDANYHICADVGCQGHISDGEVFTHTIRCTTLEKNWLCIPVSWPLLGIINAIPFVFIADDAFALSASIMKPFPGQQPKSSPELTLQGS